MFFIAVFAILTPVTIIYSDACLSSTNIEVEKLKKSIEEQENINSGLSMQVDELASLSNIQNIAKENGLVYNNDNIICTSRYRKFTNINKERKKNKIAKLPLFTHQITKIL